MYSFIEAREFSFEERMGIEGGVLLEQCLRLCSGDFHELHIGEVFHGDIGES